MLPSSCSATCGARGGRTCTHWELDSIVCDRMHKHKIARTYSSSQDQYTKGLGFCQAACQGAEAAHLHRLDGEQAQASTFSYCECYCTLTAAHIVSSASDRRTQKG